MKEINTPKQVKYLFKISKKKAITKLITNKNSSS